MDPALAPPGSSPGGVGVFTAAASAAPSVGCVLGPVVGYVGWGVACGVAWACCGLAFCDELLR